ncbi:CBS domain-containing protein [Algoriphagus namhaensis]|uniref:CBS domain-containing protein n=1 Tax=Algoriphagus namhaensis TaxID=915353 RepID=A0ABV8AQU1_9BACT
MGDLKIEQTFSDAQKARFSSHLLSDLEALKVLLQKGKIEKGITRIGAEQEFCLIDKLGRPSAKALEILELINDDHFTSELALYNLEINLDPVEFKGNALAKMLSQLNSLLDLAREKAKKFNEDILLTGILPSITKRELEDEYMTPLPRYRALNERFKQLKRGDFSLFLTGVDELSIQHESVLFEACNTSFQLHYQIDPDDFRASYNWAQAISGPCLAVACNSPLLLGRELWAETRIGLFQQSIDSRPSTYALKEQLARVTFGHAWADGDVIDYFKNEIANYRVILGKEIQGDSLKAVKNGEVPKLEALNLHNGTIYRWNRPCYGASKGVAHLRIENRYLPAGPSTLDELANLAFWAGLMHGRPKKYDNIHESMNFSDAKANFINAARVGKRAQMCWMGSDVRVEDLILDELLPVAKIGLEKAGIDAKDIEKLLGIISSRVYGSTGSEWMIKNYRALKPGNRTDHAILDLVKNIQFFQGQGIPIHQWPEASPINGLGSTPKVVAHKMSTLLFTVNKSDSAEMATQIMKWKNIHHVPVEDETGQLCGLLTWTHLNNIASLDAGAMVDELMVHEIFVTHPQTPLAEAKDLMEKHRIGCLPVVERGHLVGIITDKDF